MEQELPLTSIKIKDILKDSKLTNFERLIFALIKFYPEPKKQRELCLEAGINDSELSAWIKGRRGKEYEQFFEKYVERDVKTKGLRLKIHKDLFDRLIEISIKDKRAKEIIGKSIYFKELVSKDLRFLIIALNERIVNLERAKEIFLEMLKANGITKDKIIEKLNNISEKALSCYIKAILIDLVKELRLADKFNYKTEEKLDEIIFKEKYRVIRRFISMFIELYPLLGTLTLTVSDEYPFSFLGEREEVREFLKWMAKNIDESIFRSLDIFKQNLLSWRGDKWIVERWINIGCLYAKLKFKLEWKDLVKLLENGKCNIEVKVENCFRLSPGTCLLVSKECRENRIKNILNCEHIKRFYEAGDFETAYFEIHKEVIK